MKKSVRFMFVLGGVAFLGGCAAASLVEDRVVSRSDDLKERPSWAKMEDSGYACTIGKDGRVTKGVSSSGERYFCSLGIYNKPAKKKTNIKEMMLRAEGDARRSVVASIKTKLASAMEQATEGEDGENETGASTLNLLSDGLLRGSKVAKRYWEKKIVNTEDGQSFQYDFYVLTYISEKDLRDSIEAMAKKKNLSPRTTEMLNKGAEIVYSRDD